MKDIKRWLKRLYKDLDDCWREESLPSCREYGVLETVVGYCPTVWDIREDAYKHFKKLYGTGELLTSIEGATLSPPVKCKSKPLIRQTNRNASVYTLFYNLGEDVTLEIYRKSYKRLDETLRKIDKEEDDNNPLTLSTDSIEKIDYKSKRVKIPRGSILIISSDIIISNTFSSSGWKCIVPVTMRKKRDYTPKRLKELKRSFLEKKSTDMWGKSLPDFTDWRVKRCKIEPELLDYKVSKKILKLVGVKE